MKQVHVHSKQATGGMIATAAVAWAMPLVMSKSHQEDQQYQANASTHSPYNMLATGVTAFYVQE